MHTIQRRLLLFAFIFFLQSAPPRAAEPTELVTAINNLGFDILAHRLKANPNQNTLLSPASLGFSLALLAQGANLEAAREFSQLLSVTGLSKEQIATQASQLKQSLLGAVLNAGGPADPMRARHKAIPNPKNLDLEVADSIWIDDSAVIAPAFLDTAHTLFRSEVYPQSFANPKTCALINEWVTKKTRGKITSAPCPGSSRGSPIALINAVYFRDTWLNEFPAEETHMETFHSPQRRQKVPFMRLQNEFLYERSRTHQHVVLLFQNNRFCLDLILPKKRLGLADWLKQPASYTKSVAAAQPRIVNLKLPKLKIEGDLDLNADLARKGLNAPFAPPGLSGVSPLAYLDQLHQKTYINIDEKGAEAAAVTVAFFMNAGGPEIPPEVINVKFDRPFVFTLRDMKTGLLLFIGSATTIP